MQEDKKFPLKPLGSNVIVELNDNTKTESGIELIQETTDIWGIVKASGPRAMVVKEGDTVMLSPYDYFEHEVDGTMYAFIEEKHIVAVRS